ncbi:MAG TPA: NUDIX domain-containing protein [Jatrophihabitantaceae bacterium]|jgi:ADP-ribose pyrophosphatase YjhB (NUDIX family)
MPPSVEHVPCAGAIVFDATGRLLVVRRGRPPALGAWSIPGGRCEPGESAVQACVREVAEETGLVVEVQRRAGRVERAAPHGAVYDIEDFVCAARGGTLAAADDAADARWVSSAELGALPLAPLLYETLRDWDCLPRC